METKTYTELTLLAFGLIGVILHNLVKLNEKKKADPNGDVNYRKYFKLEWITITISVIVVGLCVWLSQEIKELEIAGKYLGLGFASIGYFSQSLLIKWIGKAEKKINENGSI